MLFDVTIFTRAFQGNLEQHYLRDIFLFSITTRVSTPPHALRVRERNLHSLRQADEMSARFKVTGMIKRSKTSSDGLSVTCGAKCVSNFPDPEDGVFRM
jgi:hypothetical protein